MSVNPTTLVTSVSAQSAGAQSVDDSTTTSGLFNTPITTLSSSSTSTQTPWDKYIASLEQQNSDYQAKVAEQQAKSKAYYAQLAEQLKEIEQQEAESKERWQSYMDSLVANAAKSGSSGTAAQYTNIITNKYTPPTSDYVQSKATPPTGTITEDKSGPTHDSTPLPANNPSGNVANTTSSSSTTTPAKPIDPLSANESATIWGDPHIEAADGRKYDFQGKAGSIYNLLSDTGVQFNGQFQQLNAPGTNGVGKTGLTINNSGNTKISFVEFTSDGVATINGKQLKDGDNVTLADGGTATFKDNSLVVTTAEGYVITQKTDSFKGYNYINATVTSGAKGVDSDGVKPTGILGETFDGDGANRITTDEQYATGEYDSSDPNQFNRQNLFEESSQVSSAVSQSYTTTQAQDYATEMQSLLSLFNEVDSLVNQASLLQSQASSQDQTSSIKTQASSLQDLASSLQNEASQNQVFSTEIDSINSLFKELDSLVNFT